MNEAVATALEAWKAMDERERYDFLRKVENQRPRFGRAAYCDNCERFDQALSVQNKRYHCTFCNHQIQIGLAVA